jgi:hypothetical protein
MNSGVLPRGPVQLFGAALLAALVFSSTRITSRATGRRVAAPGRWSGFLDVIQGQVRRLQNTTARP